MEKYVFMVEPVGSQKGNTTYHSLNFDWTEEVEKYKVFTSETEAAKRALAENGQVVEFKLTGRKVINVVIPQKKIEAHMKKIARIEKAKEDRLAETGLVDTPKLKVKRRKKRRTITKKAA